MKKLSFLQIVGIGLALIGALTGRSLAGDVIRANTNTTYNLPGAWSLGVVPGAGDVAVWDSTVTAARGPVIGGNLTWQGIRIANPTGTQSILTSVGFTLDLGSAGIDMSAATADLTISAVTNYSANQTWSIASGRTLTVGASANTGSAAINVTGPGNLRLSQNAAFGTGPVTLGGGVNIGSSQATAKILTNAFTLASDISIYTISTAFSNGGLNFNGGLATGAADRTVSLVAAAAANGSAFVPTAMFSSAVTGTGALNFVNGSAGTTPVQSVYFKTGTTVATGLTLGSGITTAFSAANVLGTSAKLQIDSGGTLQLADIASLTTYKTITYSQTVGALNGSGSVTSEATVNVQGTLTVDSSVTNVDSTFSGTITNNATAKLGLAKAGSNTLTLSGANSYTGTTAVNSGTLLINGSHSGTGAITVATGATFGRTGSTGVSLGGNLTFGDGSLITLSLGAALANSSLDRTAGTWVFDANQAFKFDLTGAVIGNYTGLITGLVGTETGLATINTWTISNAGALGTFSYNAGSVDLNLTAVPEPSTWMLLAGVGTFFMVMRRRRG